MALINCPECTTQVSDRALSCPKCAYPIAQAPSESKRQRSSGSNDFQVVSVAKSRGTFIILGLLFGIAGFHNFYSGHNISGAIKLTVLLIAFLLDASTRFYTAWSLVAAGIFGIWMLIELIVVRTDANGVTMS